MVKVGCCGFPTNHATYYRTFPIVEIQQTFYQLPQIKTAEKWRAEAPKNFEFAMKAWQLITHEPMSPTYRRLRTPIPQSKYNRYGSFRPTDEVFKALDETRAFANVLGASIVVFQCPASFTPTAEHVSDLKKFFKCVKRDGLVFCWEPRGKWEPTLVSALCDEFDLVHCVDPFLREPVTKDLWYFRLHGKGGYTYQYTASELRQLLRIVGRSPRPTYVLFNNAAMWEDARQFSQAAKDYCMK